MPAPVGRPSYYTPELADQVVAKMAEGISLTAAMAELGFHRQRAYEWAEEHKELADALKLGQGLRQAFHERRLIKAQDGPMVTSSIFALKNTGTGDWRDRHEFEHNGKDGGPIQIEDKGIEDIGRRIAYILARGLAAPPKVIEHRVDE